MSYSKAITGFACTTEDMHPYECGGPSECMHCRKEKTEPTPTELSLWQHAWDMAFERAEFNIEKMARKVAIEDEARLIREVGKYLSVEWKTPELVYHDPERCPLCKQGEQE